MELEALVDFLEECIVPRLRGRKVPSASRDLWSSPKGEKQPPKIKRQIQCTLIRQVTLDHFPQERFVLNPQLSRRISQALQRPGIPQIKGDHRPSRASGWGRVRIDSAAEVKLVGEHQSAFACFKEVVGIAQMQNSWVPKQNIEHEPGVVVPIVLFGGDRF